MSRLILHVGYAKCASTSLQQALQGVTVLHYPRAGRIGAEHIALPLKLKGIDPWTRQFVDDDWVEREFEALQAEINGSSRTVAVSSERLVDIDDNAKARLRDVFPDRDIDIVVIRRPVDDLLRSTWCHLVVRQDHAEPWDEYRERNRGFDMSMPVAAWRRHYTVHEVDMGEPGWADRLSSIFGADVALGHENRGAGMAAARRLQQIHAEVGTERFKSFFTPERKHAFVQLYARPKNG